MKSYRRNVYEKYVLYKLLYKLKNNILLPIKRRKAHDTRI